MNKIILCIIVLSPLLSHCCFAEKIRIPVGVYSEHLAEFQRSLIGGHCPHPLRYPITDNQVLAEFLIFCEALKIGGLEPIFDFKVFPVYVRLLRELDSSSIAALAFGAWRRDLDEKRFYISSPIVPAGNFIKGIYVAPKNVFATNMNARAQIRALTAVTNASWDVDVEAIGCIGSRIVSARTYINMFRMIGVGRADFLLTTFPAGDDLEVELYGVKLRPIEGVKIIFKDSLHYAVSKNHANGKKIFSALEIGLTELIKDGTIHTVMERLGLINPRVSSWKNIGCD